MTLAPADATTVESETDMTKVPSTDTPEELPPNPEALVSIRNVSKAFGETTVLDTVDCDFRAGEITVVIGRSGSGKSTLLRAIAGLTDTDSGTIDFEGVRVVEGGGRTGNWAASRSTIGMVFQSYTLWPHMSVLQGMTFAPRIVLKKGKAELRELAHAALDEVGMADYLESKPHQLSGGQRQRVAIARALMMRPRLLLCDEITSALDPPVAAEVLGVLSRLKRDEGIGVVLVTHDMAFASKAADRVLFFDHGRIAVDETPAAAFENSSNEELRRFVDAVRF
jgi:polar amino acid transport system ATP-binding protein